MQCVVIIHATCIPEAGCGRAVIEKISLDTAGDHPLQPFTRPKQKNTQAYEYSVKLYAPIHEAEDPAHAVYRRGIYIGVQL